MTEPTQSQLMDALRRADAAGDEQAARAIAKRIDSQRKQAQPGKSYQQQVASGVANTAMNLGSGLLDTGAAVTDRMLGAVDWATGGWELPENIRARSNELREGMRGANEARNQQFQQDATGLERGAATGAEIASYFVPAAKVDKAVRGAGVLARGASQAGAAMGLDTAFQAGEGAQEQDAGRTGMVGAAAFGAEMIAPVFAKIGRAGLKAIRSAKKNPVEVGREIARQAGYENVSDDVARRISRASDEIEAGAKPESIVFEQANDVRLSRAQKTGYPADFRAEEYLQSKSNPRMTNFRNAQRGDVERLVARQTNNLDSPQTAVDDIQSGVRQAYSQAKQGEKQAWEFAKSSDLVTSGKLADDFAERTTQALKADGRIVNQNIATEARGVIDEVNNVLRTAADEGGIDFKRIEEARKMLTKSQGSIRDPSSRAAIGIAKREFDAAIDDIAEATVIRGDVGDIEKLKNAIGTSREVFRKFTSSGSKDRVGKIVERIIDDGNLDDLSNFVLGSSAVSKPAAANAVKAVKRAVGDDPEMLQQFQDAVLLKAFTNQAGDVAGEQAIASNLKKLLKSRRELLGELFSKRDLSQLELMARGFDSMKSPFRSSGTAERTAAFDEIASRLPLGERLKAIRDALKQRMMANRALSPLQLPGSAPIVPATGAAIANRPNGQ